MSSEEFWSLTSEEYDARLDRWDEEQRVWNLRFHVPAAAYYNCHRKEGASPISAADLLPSIDEDGDDSEDHEMTPEESINAVMAIYGPDAAERATQQAVRSARQKIAG